MINWQDPASVIENIGVDREEAERIAVDVKKLSRDLETFNTPQRLRDTVYGVTKVVSEYGIRVGSRETLRGYARHIWQQTRKPRSVYRGGRWRQMDLLMRQKAIVWAFEAERDD